MPWVIEQAEDFWGEHLWWTGSEWTKDQSKAKLYSNLQVPTWLPVTLPVRAPDRSLLEARLREDLAWYVGEAQRPVIRLAKVVLNNQQEQ